jgi:hypothetical protein
MIKFIPDIHVTVMAFPLLSSGITNKPKSILSKIVTAFLHLYDQVIVGSSVVPRFAGAENSNHVENHVASGNCLVFYPYHGPSSGWTYQKIDKIGGKIFEYRRSSPPTRKEL